jgi:hypothetical protein
MRNAETILAVIADHIHEWTEGEPDDAKVCAAERGVESLTQSGGARRNAPGSSD